MSSPNAFPPRIALDEHVRNVDTAAHVRGNNPRKSPAGPLNAIHRIGRSLVRHVSNEICGQITGKPELSETHSQFLVDRLHRSNFSQARFWSTYGLRIIVTSGSRVSGLTAPTCGSWKCLIDVLPLHVIVALESGVRRQSSRWAWSNHACDRDARLSV